MIKIDQYLSINRSFLIPNLPILISINGWSFSKVCKNLSQPFSNEFAELCSQTLVSLAGKTPACFGYQFSDKFYLVFYPEEVPWFKGNIQSLASIFGSLITKTFYTIWKSHFSYLDLHEDPLFNVEVCSLPNLSLAVELLIELQKFSLNDFFDRILVHLGYDYSLNWSEKEEIIKANEIDLSIYSDNLKLGTCAFKEYNAHQRKKWIGKKILIFQDNKDYLFRILLNSHK